MTLIRPLFVCLLLAANLIAAEVNPTAAIKMLMEGNERYVNNKPQVSNQLEKKRKGLLSSQAPFAIIIGCSDSRVPPEIIFDQSLGDIFVVRIAGNVVGPLEMDSIEFAADKLFCPLIFVLGHQGCGAVNAVLAGKAVDDDLQHIAPLIQKAVDASKNLPGDRLKNAIVANVQLNMSRLEKNTVLKSLIDKKKLKVIGGYYDLQSGKVEQLGPSP
jgi:carbonic anhydrase